MSAMQTLLAGLFDYAGLYPPASVDMCTAASNYLRYGSGVRASACGRFIVNAGRLEELRDIAGDSLSKFRLSVIAGSGEDWEAIAEERRRGLCVEAVECKGSDSMAIDQAAAHTGDGLEVYVEVPMAAERQMLEAIKAAGMRAKIRMGGVVPEAIPPARDVAGMLKMLIDAELSFKATAGLHHPLRSMRPLTYEPRCPAGMMHGFVNLSAAAALLYFGGSVAEAEQALAEEDEAAWGFTHDSLRWRERVWTTEQVATVRQEFFLSVGSCSFEEPMQDLESLGWL